MLTNDFLPDINPGQLVTLREAQRLCRLSDEVHFPHFFFHNFQFLLWGKLLSLIIKDILDLVLSILLIKTKFSFSSLLRTCLESMQGN